MVTVSLGQSFVIQSKGWRKRSMNNLVAVALIDSLVSVVSQLNKQHRMQLRDICGCSLLLAVR